MGFIFLPLMFLVLWAIVILPQQRRMRAHRALVSVLKEGDEVMTTSGILGTITAMDDEVLHLEVAPGVRLRIVRRDRSSHERTRTGDCRHHRRADDRRRGARGRAGRGRAIGY